MNPHRIDVHHHAALPSQIRLFGGDGRGAPALRDWSLQKSLDDMERGSVATSILSLPHPAEAWSGDPRKGQLLAREWNEFMTRIARDHSGKFGVFATLPILDIDGSLREIEYALDTLGADGVLLMTNIGDRWLGDAHYTPVFEELNRRKAVVYTHPLSPDCCTGILPEVNDSIIEYGTDTTRAIAKLLFTGAAARFPDIRFIFSHAGGTMPFLAERFTRGLQFSKQEVKDRIPGGMVPALNRFYYDTAQAAHSHAMSSFRTVVDVSRLLFGTDFPYRTAEETVQGLRECGCFSDGELKEVERGNAEGLLPKWSKENSRGTSAT